MKKISLALILSLTLYSNSALPSGNTLPRPNGESLGMADANVALADGPAAQFINPANVIGSRTMDGAWEAGALLGQVDAYFSRPVAASGATAGDMSARRNKPLIPYFAYAKQCSSHVAVGFSIDSPHGTSIEWKDHTWDISLGGFGTADMTKLSQLSVLRFGPAAGLKLDDHWSIGGRLFAQYINAVDENDIATLRADGASAGVMLGVRYQTADFVLGIAYTTPTNTKLNGEQTGIHPVATSLVPGSANARMLLPGRLQAGTAFRLRSDLWWEIDLDWIGWSYYDELRIYQANGTVVSPAKAERHYSDTVSIRTGVKWLKNQHLTLYAGLGYDPTPVPDRDVTPATSFLKKSRLAVGGRYDLERDSRIELAYQYIHGLRRTINATDQDLFGSTDTHLYEGVYESKTHVLGVSFIASF